MGKTKGSKFALVRADQKEQSASRKEKLKLDLKLRLLEKNVSRLENNLKNFVENPPKKKKKKMFLKRTGQLYGAARPAESLELSEYGCGLRKFECEEQCNHETVVYKNLWKDLVQEKKLSSHNLGLEYCKTSMELAEIYYALHRTDDAIRVLEGIVVVDEKNDSVKAKEALDDIQIALAEEAKGVSEEHTDSALENKHRDQEYHSSGSMQGRKRNRHGGIGGPKGSKKKRRNNRGKKRR